MNVFVYGDESGVFDKAHNAFFVFGGIILLDKGEKDSLYRQFISAERKIAAACGLDGVELKARGNRERTQARHAQLRLQNLPPALVPWDEGADKP